MLILKLAHNRNTSSYRCPPGPPRPYLVCSNLQIVGSWYVIQYYATSEEDIIYRCMRASFSHGTESTENSSDGSDWKTPQHLIDLNVTYSFVDDPDNEQLTGNITYSIPDPSKPSHWIHSEPPFLETYNTYILDSDNNEWALLLNCAEKPKSPRYLTSLMMSRNPTLAPAVISFLRDKLPKSAIF
ncbi:unnamed protein product [Nesidiocoris tenuis]|uniref:VDE lipocalin domain-containing protein n=1 Tax=Nesidiocoris tenuis TaxID=355587 RepID=A0A6H5HLM4_9HEMI|nr:unnamed protein product [Nesidiocoris tenuis]